MKLGSNYWNIGWGSGAADPFRDGYQNVVGPDPWKPEFLAETAFYKMHRFMDFNQTNRPHEPSWSARTQKSDRNQRTMAYEWMVDLCNRQRGDAWITVPHRTYEDQDYWTSLAQLVFEQLDQDLKLYIEYSNETWNFIFDQASYCRDKGVELGLDEDQYKAGFEFHVYAAVRLFERFEAVWGATNPRLIKVVCGQSVNTWMTGVHLAALGNSVINPNNIRPTAYGIAPYFGSGQTTIEGLANAVQTGIDRAAAQAEAVRSSGLKLIAYEGGQHVVSSADVVNRNPRMYDIYTTYLNGVSQHLEEMAHYCHSASFGSDGAWGSKEFIGQPNNLAHKYRALLDYADESPVEETLVPFNSIWKYNTETPPDDWTLLEFDDTAWDMQEGDEEEPAVYLRREFNSTLPSARRLRLSVQHEEGFVAYLNGTEVLRVQAGSADRVYDIDQHAHLVRAGRNVLAIKLLTEDFDKADLSVNPELWASS